MLMRAAAVAVGKANLESLIAHYKAAEKWVEAATVTRAISTVSAARSDRVKHARAALALLEQAGSETTKAQQLELDIRGSLQYLMHTGPEKKQRGAYAGTDGAKQVTAGGLTGLVLCAGVSSALRDVRAKSWVVGCRQDSNRTLFEKGFASRLTRGWH